MDITKTTTTFTLEGCKIVQNLGIVRGIAVRSLSLVNDIFAGFQTLRGGNIELMQELCETTRKQAFDMMLTQAQDLGANAIIGIRYDATEVRSGVTEVLCYGTAVIIEQIL